MTELLTAAQMRAIEQEAIASGRVTGLELMERAGAGVVEAALEEWPDLAERSHRAVVLCGPGNNGGDGFVVARLLHARGWQVEVFLHGDPHRLQPDARTNHARWCALGTVRPFPRELPDPRAPALIVDSLFGTGLARPLSDDLIGAVFGCMPQADLKPLDAPPHVVSVDIPTGLSADTGALLPRAVRADLTVTFHAPKLGHFLDRGPEFCGSLKRVDIGLGPDQAFDGSGRNLEPPPSSLSKYALARLATGPGAGRLGKHGHKYDNGHALVLTGGAGRSGAARLAARGALRVGAGLVTLGVPGSAQMECAAQVTAVMLARVEDGAGLAERLADTRLNALCLGPGLGIARARDLVPVAMRARHAPCLLLDADALTAFADDPETLFSGLHENCVLTPHGGEFARLFPDIAEKLNARAGTGPAFSKLDATREAARRAGCVVLYKGPDTVIADPRGRACVNAAVYDRAAPWLATAGSGDVLAGMICGLMARGFPAMQAAETAAWLHVECARSFGPGLIAEDLPETLPKVFRALRL